MDFSAKLTEWLGKLSDKITNYSKTTIVLILLITIFFGFWIPALQIDNSVDDMLPSSHPAKKLYDRVTETFGGTNTIIVAYRNDTIFSQQTLNLISELTNQFSQVQGVADVKSLANAKQLEGANGGLAVTELIPPSGIEPRQVPESKAYVRNNRMLRGTVLSEDGKYAGFVVELASGASDSKVYKELNTIIDQQASPKKFYLAGGPAVNAEMASSMKNDLVTLVPIVLFVLALVLYLSLRTAGGVYIPISVVVLSTIWTLGLMGLTGTAMSMISTTLPVMLLAIGVADAIHILNDYYHRLERGTRLEEAINSVMKHIGTAIVLTSVTTAVGFLSLTTTPVSQVKEFGIFIGFGVMAALIISVTWIPSLLSLTDHAQQKMESTDGEGSGDAGSAILAKLGEYVVAHRTLILVTGLLILGMAAYGSTLLTVETNTLRFFRPNSEIRQATEIIDESFGGSQNLSIVIYGDIKDPEVLKGMLQLQNRISKMEQVGYTLSIVNLVTEINRALTGKEKIPATKNAISQELLLYEMSADSSELNDLVNYNYNKARITVRLKSTSSNKLAEIITTIKNEAEQISGDAFHIRITGSSYLFKVLTDLLVNGQIISLSIALVGVAIIVGLIFLSIKFGLLSIIPLGFTIAVNFGLMGLLGIPLDTATTMLASIAIGIGVDYTIHFISRYRLELGRTENYETAVVEAIRTTGQAIFFNAVAVAMGFGVLLASNFTPIATLGALVALTMVLAASWALTLLPAALLWVEES